MYQSHLGFINFIEILFLTLFFDLFKKLNFCFDRLNDNKNKLNEMQKMKKIAVKVIVYYLLFYFISKNINYLFFYTYIFFILLCCY